LVVLAPVAIGRLRRVVIVLTVVETFLGVSSLKGMVETLGASGVLQDLLLLVAMVIVIVVPLSLAGSVGTPGLHRPRRSRAGVTLGGGA
jgi:hypothetical protein